MRVRIPSSGFRSVPSFLAIVAVASVPSGAAFADGARFERAIAADLTAAGCDAIVFRLPDGTGAGVFLPMPGGRFSLTLDPALGPDVSAITLGDADHDGRADLVVARADGELFFWKGLEGGDFTSDLVDTSPPSHDMHAAHNAAQVGPPPLKGSERERILASLSHDSIRTDSIVAELGEAAASLVTDDARSATSIDLDGDGVSEVALLTPDGRLQIVKAGVGGKTDVRLPDGFAPRLVVAGRFGPGDGRSLAVVGEGTRPRLVLVSTASSVDPVVREASAPETIFNVNVAQGGGRVFAPSSVTIQVNDTVHWVWMGSGHTVTSGNTTTCTADNLFCSPSDTSCATAPTSNINATYDHVFPAAGTFPYFCRPHCSSGMTGSVTVQAGGTPGVVPDRAPATPLRVDPGAGGSLDLTWGASCSPGATAYGIYEGTIPISGTYDHKSNVCPAGTSTTATITPGVGDHYYLVVPRTTTAEGSYGTSSANIEIPQGANACAATQDLASCP